MVIARTTNGKIVKVLGRVYKWDETDSLYNCEYIDSKEKIQLLGKELELIEQ